MGSLPRSRARDCSRLSPTVHTSTAHAIRWQLLTVDGRTHTGHVPVARSAMFDGSRAPLTQINLLRMLEHNSGEAGGFELWISEPGAVSERTERMRCRVQVLPSPSGSANIVVVVETTYWDFLVWTGIY